MGIVLSDISKSFASTRALDGVSLEARPGRVHAVLGENGAGKSTLMKILAGALRPDGGDMRLGGERLRAQGSAGCARVAALPSCIKSSRCART